MRRRALALVLCSAAFMVPLAGAHAFGATPVRYQLTFKAKRYTVTASGESATVTIEVTRDEPAKHRRQETAYFARGAAAGGLRATFAGVGRIAMRFEPVGPWHPVAHCRPRNPLEGRRGTFVGGLRFVGEGRYLTVSRSHAPGVEQRSAPACPAADTRKSLPRRRGARLSLPSTGLSPPRRRPRTRVAAWFRSGPLARTFEATELGKGRSALAATEQDVVDGLGTFRIAYASAPSGDLRADPALSSASLKGVTPFAGSATLSRAENGARSWTGDLTVSFLGDPGVPMTGSLFRTRLSRGF